MNKGLLLLLLFCAPLFAQQQPAVPATPEAAKLPLHLGIVMLASKTTFQQQQAAATELIQTLIKNPDDEAFVIAAGGEKMWPYPRLEWEHKADSLAKFIKGMDKNTGMPDAFGFHVDVGSGTDFRSWITTFKGGDPQQSAFGVVAQMMASDPRPARRVVILFRDPWAHTKGWGGATGRSGDFTRAVDDRHNWIIGAYRQLGITAYIVGLDDPNLKPQMQSELASTYNTLHGNAGQARVFDEDMRKALDRVSADGRTNLDRIAKETNGIVVYSSKKNYSDAVQKIESALGGADSSAINTGK